jgi:molybdate transport system substrate-binding protein
MEKRTGWRGAGALAAALFVAAGAGCGGSSGDGLGTVTVFAASSLTEAFTELGARLEDDHPGTTVTFNFASSSDLALQVTEGAPADVFASADPIQMRRVEDAGTAENPVPFTTNELIILVPDDNPAGIEVPEDITKPGVKLVLAAPEVPAGNYARRAFEALGIAADAEANVVSNEDDVKTVVTKVSLGEADAGVTYVTDVTDEIENNVDVIEFPAEVGVRAIYPITVLADAPNPEGAKAFYELVLSEEGDRVLASYGFGRP